MTLKANAISNRRAAYPTRIMGALEAFVQDNQEADAHIKYDNFISKMSTFDRALCKPPTFEEWTMEQENNDAS